MSRIQKKKFSKDKNKRKTESARGKNVVEGSVGSASSSAPVAKAVKLEKATAVPVGEPNFFQRGMEFFREVKIELKKVTWPTQKQTTGTTIVVIIFVFVVAAFLGLFDYSLSKLVQVILT